MNALLQSHGCANVFNVPEGLKELMSDITREVLRDQPANILDYIASYLSALLITREHGILAVKILEELCDCRPTLEERLATLGLAEEHVTECAKIIQERFDGFDPAEGEKLKEKAIMKTLLSVVELDAEQAACVCEIIQDVYREYWQRKQALQETISSGTTDEPWKIAADRTIEIYKTTRPTFDELVRATEKIQAAYRGYHVRKQMIAHLRPSPCPVVSTTTALDVAGSREIYLGPKMDLRLDDDEAAAEESAPPRDELVVEGQQPEPGAGTDDANAADSAPPPPQRSVSLASVRKSESRQPSRTTYQGESEEEYEYDASHSEAEGVSVTASSVTSDALTTAVADDDDDDPPDDTATPAPPSESDGELEDGVTTDAEEAD